jgi:acyl-CoA reductase-like NAD-dependent aldehyde dehydrogenase
MIPALIKGAFYHAGQVCVSTQRIFIPENLTAKFLDLFKSAAENLVTGDPINPETQVGPIISKTELERIHSWVEEAISKGAQLICGGEKISESLYKPTILFNPSDDSKISTLEIFGPVVAVYSYKQIEEAVLKANNTPYHFQASVFSASIEKAKNILNQLNASTVMINDHTAFRVDWMPFGGRDQSGLGTGGIKYSIEEMMPEKLAVVNE